MGRIVKTEAGLINFCNIVFDEKFKVFIQTMRNKFIGYLEISNGCPYYVLSVQQERYRDYIAERKDELTLIESKKCINQEYFAILVSLIIPNTDSIEKFEDVFKNYKTDFTVVDNNLYDDENQTQIDKTYCACGHKVKSNNVYNLINNTTGYNLLIGCDCIDKYKILSEE